MLNKLETLLVSVAMVVIIVAGVVYLNTSYNVVPQVNPLGSVTGGNEYAATSTADYGVGAVADRLIDNGRGTLGSIVITKAGDAEYQLLDATSTGAITTDPRYSTSSQLLASIPASATVGTYVFDISYNHGLLLEVVTGTTGSTTITYRK